MERLIRSEVFIYHDETACAGNENLRGHILFFVPVITIVEFKDSLFGSQTSEYTPWTVLFEKIEEIRNKFNENHKFHFSKISGKKWYKQDIADKYFTQLGVEALKQKNMFCKLGIIFYKNPKSCDIAGYGGNKKKEKLLRFYETILRMLFKGIVHHLYDNNNKVKILKIITDGEPYHRKLSNYRILERLIDEIKDFVEIDKDAEINPNSSDHKKYNKNFIEYIHANMLQLSDMLLGSTIYSCLKNSNIEEKNPRIKDYVKDKKGIIACPVKKMLDKRKRKSGFQNSIHYKAFIISKAIIKNGKWKFEDVMTKEILIDQVSSQINLFE